MLRKQKAPEQWSWRRTRYEPPTVDEAITAAQSLTDQVESQIEIVAQLMGLREEDVREQVLMTGSANRAQSSHRPIVRIQNRRIEVTVVERRGRARLGMKSQVR